MSVFDTVKLRISCRTYQAKPVVKDLREQLDAFILSNTGTPFGSRLRFQLLDLSGMERSELKQLGTYGVIRGASFFIAGAVTSGPTAMEDFGYAMEKNVLMATELGLGTCWLGGTFNRSGFAGKMSISEDELIPAITPVGYAHQKRSLMDRLFRFTASSHTRKPWKELFFQGSFDEALTAEEAGGYGIALEALRLAPSASNKQPWRVVKEKGRDDFHLYLRRTPAYDRLIQGIKLQNIDMGIAMSHFETVARDTGLAGAWIRQVPDMAAVEAEYIATWRAQ